MAHTSGSAPRDILAEIVARRRQDVEVARAAVPPAELVARAASR
jgi:indole-3-glycerol phosphate synthase/phosphoribosylanthranilate isomerase